jgi:hypothetical protein
MTTAAYAFRSDERPSHPSCAVRRRATMFTVWDRAGSKLQQTGGCSSWLALAQEYLAIQVPVGDWYFYPSHCGGLVEMRRPWSGPLVRVPGERRSHPFAGLFIR